MRRLEIAGFKSFGSRVKLDFQPGVSAIVGPNGSGKSNVADAIRWVMGEQNARNLRTRKTEELIYAGSEGAKAKASMAEVTLTLEGEPGDTKLGVSELVISRRLYRSGETEYRLAGRKVLVKDLQRILAQAGFGASSYSVISQGMIDTLLIASPAERKLLFEEASGIRAFELERVDTTRKLARATEQAAQLRAEVAILAPEREALARQVAQLDRQRDIREALKTARLDWVSTEARRLEAALDAVAAQTSRLRDEEKAHARQLRDLEGKAAALERADVQAQADQAGAVKQLEDLDRARTDLAEKIATLQAQQALVARQATTADRPAELEKSLAANRTRLAGFKTYLAELTVKAAELESKIAEFNDKIATFNAELTSYRQQIAANQRNEFLTQALALARVLNDHLQNKTRLEPGKARVLVHRLIRMVKLASESDMTTLPAAIAKLQQQIGRELTRREDVVEKQTNEIIRQRSVELDINALEREIAEQEARLKTMTRQQAVHDADVADSPAELTKLLAERDQLEARSREQREALANYAGTQTTAEQVELAHALEQAKAQRDAAASGLVQAATDQARIQSELAALKDQAKAWRLTDWASHSATMTATPGDIARLEAELTVLGEIDESLVEVHKEVAEKVSYLEGQASDLEQAATDLTKVLAELERRIKDTFEANFARINQAFARHFAKLFRGGTAALKLIPADDGSYGIEITAKPPGKRVELLASLSGGEKAMAAIALLAAILDVNPSPFIVLDEVDAALDDANSHAFTSVLKSLAKKSQLLVITHNHETMLQSDELFGITSSPKTSSTVIAVDLRETEALAA